MKVPRQDTIHVCVSERKSKWNAEVPGSKGKESGVILKISFQQSRTMESLEKRRRHVETGGEQQASSGFEALGGGREAELQGCNSCSGVTALLLFKMLSFFFPDGRHVFNGLCVPGGGD